MPTFDKRFLQRIRIPLGFFFAIVFIVFARPAALSLLIGGCIALIGLLRPGLGVRAYSQSKRISGHRAIRLYA